MRLEDGERQILKDARSAKFQRRTMATRSRTRFSLYMVCVCISIHLLPGSCQDFSRSREATGEEESDNTHVGESRHLAVEAICLRTKSAYLAEVSSVSTGRNPIYSGWLQRFEARGLEDFGSYFSKKPKSS